LIARVSPMYVQSKRCPVGNTKTLARTDTASFRVGVGVGSLCPMRSAAVVVTCRAG